MHVWFPAWVFVMGCSTPQLPTAATAPAVADPGPGDEEKGDPMPPWVDAAVQEAVDWEEMPGTTSEDDPARRDALRAFFLAHPVYEDPARRQALADMACAMGTEAAHERLAKQPPAKPMVVEVKGPAWRLVVAHASDWCTSDDWAYFTHTVDEGVTARGIDYAYAGAEVSEVVVTSGGAEQARLTLDGQGYLLAKANARSQDAAHDMPDGVLEQAWDYFGDAPPPSAAPSSTAQPAARFAPIHAAHAACIEADPTQTGLNLCGRDTRDRWIAEVTALEKQLSTEHPGLDLTRAWAAHRDAEFAWLTQIYTRDGSMWSMVHAGHQSRFLEDRATELAYDLCAPRPIVEPGDDCYSDAVGEHDAFVLCDEAVYDADLHTAYQQLLSKCDPPTQALLKASQRLWLAHRDVDTPVCSKMTDEVDRTLRVRHRVEQLRRYLEAAEEGM